MTPDLAAAYQQLVHARHLVNGLAPGTVAQLEQRGAAGEHALARYGVDLTDAAQLDAVVAVIDLCVRATGEGCDVLLATVGHLQQTLIATTRTTDRSST